MKIIELYEQAPLADLHWGFEWDGYLYHTTGFDQAQAILRSGVIVAPSFWGVEDLVSYYKDEYHEPVVFRVAMRRFDQTAFTPDKPALEEPVGLNKNQAEQVWDLWSESDQTWHDSLAIVGSVIYHKEMPISDKDVYASMIGTPIHSQFKFR